MLLVIHDYLQVWSVDQVDPAPPRLATSFTLGNRTNQQIRKLQLYLTGMFSSPGRPADQDSDPPKRCPAPGVLVRHPHGGAVGDHAPPQRAAKSHHCTPPLNGLGETLIIVIIYYFVIEI